MEDRIVNLEATVAFHEHTIAELSQLVGEQQVQLQALEAQVRRLAEQARVSAAGDQALGGEEPPPPHY